MSGRRIFTAAIVMSLMAAPAAAQSLGELSRQEEARRATTKKAVKTLSNSDLDPSEIAQPASAAPAEASCYMSKSKGECVPPEEMVSNSVAGVVTKDNAGYEPTFRGEADSIRSQIQQARSSIATFRAVIADQGRAASDRKGAEKALAGAQEALAGAERNWEKLEREVGNRHLPHKWIEPAPPLTKNPQ